MNTIKDAYERFENWVFSLSFMHDVRPRTVGITLLIFGILAFLYAGQQVSNIPSDIFLFGPMQPRFHALKYTYHLVQLISGFIAIWGGVLMVREVKL